MRARYVAFAGTVLCGAHSAAAFVVVPGSPSQVVSATRTAPTRIAPLATEFSSRASYSIRPTTGVAQSSSFALCATAPQSHLAESPTSSPNSGNPPPPSPLINMVSSPVGAILVLAFIVLFHESGHYFAGKALGLHPDEFSIGLGPKLFGFQAMGGDDFSVRLLPFGGYVSFSVAQVQAMPPAERLVVLSTGVMFNQLLAFLVFLHQILFGSGLSKPVVETGILVTGVVPDAPAKGRLEPGDVIVAINGEPIKMPRSPSAPRAHRAITKAIETVHSTPEGQSLRFSIQRPAPPGEGTASRSAPMDVVVIPRQLSPDGPPSVGVFLEPNLVGFEQLKAESVPAAVALASSYALALTGETASGFVTYFGDLVSGKAKSSEYRVSGPVGVIQRATEVVKTQDWTTVARYAAALSVNLSVLNLLPIPPMDGFQIATTLFQMMIGGGGGGGGAT